MKNLSADALKFSLYDLMGIFVWVEDPNDELPKDHATAVKYFELSNPEAFEKLKTANNLIAHFGVTKSNLPGKTFWDNSLEAATKQAEAVGPCTLVVQWGFMEVKNLEKLYRYALYTYFRSDEACRIDGRNSRIELE